MKKIIFINPHGGRAKKAGELANLLDLLKQQPDLEIKLLAKNDDLTQLAKQAVKQGATLVGAAGGDGTINGIASGLVGSNVPLVTIPFGTLNHFARDIGVSNNLSEAVQLFSEGTQQLIDVGQVNDRYFLNNSSLGIYPYLVRLREKREKELGKWRAYIWATRQALRNPPSIRVRLNAVDDIPNHELRVGLLFVANNQCDVWLPKPGHRACLTDNVLDLYVVEAKNQLKLFSLSWHFLINHLERLPEIQHSTPTEFWIETSNQNVSVARDGEVAHMQRPLMYKSCPQALWVRIPAKLDQT
jgi:diacylglycerol kinase family enzyme